MKFLENLAAKAIYRAADAIIPRVLKQCTDRYQSELFWTLLRQAEEKNGKLRAHNVRLKKQVGILSAEVQSLRQALKRPDPATAQAAV